MKARIGVGILAVVLFFSIFPGVASAQIPITPGTSCFGPKDIPADGRLHSFTLGGMTSVWFTFQGRANHSYSIDVYVTDQTGQPNGLTILNTTDACGAASTLTTQATTTTLPSLSQFGDGSVGFRRTFIAPNSGEYRVNVDHSIDSASHPTIISVSETTLFNPLWSTFSNFETFYRIQNTVNSTCNVKLTLRNDANAVVATTVQSVQAGRTLATINTGPGPFPGLGVANNQAGGATIAHDCPPGGVQVDGFLGIFTGTPIVLPIKIVPAREATH